MSSLVLRTSWQGIDELDLRIDRLIDLVESAAIFEALLPGAEYIAELWRSKVPQPGPDHEYATGEYHDSIHVAPGMSDEFGIPGLDIYTDAVNPNTGFNYPEALEFGTSRMAAQPSAIPAFDEGTPVAIEMAVARLDALVLLALSR